VGVTATKESSTAARLKVVDAWQEYLETCQQTADFSYDEVEPWAWTRLRRTLAEAAA
jgi:hypothetical protein